MHSYAGIGTRNLGPNEFALIGEIATYLYELGYVMYSGNAAGSDHAFASGCRGYGVNFLPSKSFNSFLRTPALGIAQISDEAYESVNKFHPAPNRLSTFAHKLMARNYQQVRGLWELPPVDLVICCANEVDGEVQGGTGQAIRIAKHFGIPHINIRADGWQSKIENIQPVQPISGWELDEIVHEIYLRPL